MNFEKSCLRDSQERTPGAAEWVAHVRQFILYHTATFMPGPYRVVPPNVKAQILLLYDDNHSVKDICHILGIKKSLVYRTLSLYSKYGTITNLSRYSCSTGCHQLLSSADIAFISTIVQHHNTIYLDELQHELWAKHHKFATLSNLLQTLQRLCITRKVVSSAAAEQNEETRLQNVNATISAKKFVLAAPDATIVGHKCTSKGWVLHEAKIQKIRDWPECENLTQVCRFLAICSVLQIFIRNFAAIARPLVGLTQKGILFEWGKAQRAAMIRLKDEIIQSPALWRLDYESGQEIVLAVDTLVIAVGFILSQEGEDGKRYPNRFGSISLTSVESRYSQAKLKLYGLFCSL